MLVQNWWQKRCQQQEQVYRYTDTNSSQGQGLFDIPCKNLTAETVVIQWTRKNFQQVQNLIVAVPDAGGSKRVNPVAEECQFTYFTISKHLYKTSKKYHIKCQTYFQALQQQQFKSCPHWRICTYANGLADG